MKNTLIIILVFISLLAGCIRPSDPVLEEVPTIQPAEEKVAGTISGEWVLSSPAFKDGENIPPAFSCDGQDISPQLDWTAPPEGTQSLALIMDDPDAPGGLWVHWVLYNIPPDSQTLSENIPPDPELEDGSLHGANSWQRNDYGGPCPPGGTHRYYFKIYALDTKMEVGAGLTDQQILKRMEGHVLGETQLMGTYQR